MPNLYAAHISLTPLTCSAAVFLPLWASLMWLCGLPKFVLKGWVRTYYLYAPKALMGWEGAAHDDICFGLSGIAASHWRINENECALRINQAVDSWVVAVSTGILLFLTFQIMYTYIPLFCRRTGPYHPTVINIPAATQPPARSSTPISRRAASVKAQATKDLNELNKRKVIMYETFLRLLMTRPLVTTLAEVLPALPKEVTVLLLGDAAPQEKKEDE